MTWGWPPASSGCTFERKGPGESNGRAARTAGSRSTRWRHLQPVRKMAGGRLAAVGHSRVCPHLWWSLPRGLRALKWTLSPNECHQWTKNLAFTHLLNGQPTTPNSNTSSSIHFRNKCAPQNRRNADHLFPQKTYYHIWLFSSEGKIMKRLVMWKSIYSSWVTILSHTTSHSTLLNLPALKNTGEQTSQLRKPTTKQCKWLGQVVCGLQTNSPGSLQRQGSCPFRAKKLAQDLSPFNLPSTPVPQSRSSPCCMQRTHQGKADKSPDTPPSSSPTLLLVWVGSNYCSPCGLVVLCPEQQWCSETAEPTWGLEASTFFPLQPSPQPIRKSRLDHWGIRGHMERGCGGRDASLDMENSHQERPPRWVTADPQNHEK